MKKLFLSCAIIASCVLIWNCSQDEMEPQQVVFRYSGQELKQIQEMAEEYGIPEVQYIKESDKELPSLKELKETFEVFAAIKSCMSLPLDIQEEDSTTMIYRTRMRPFKRIQYGGEVYSGNEDLSTYVSVSSYRCWLNMKVSWYYTNPTVGTPEQIISASASLELFPDLEILDFHVEDAETSWEWVGSTGIRVSYSANIVKRDNLGRVMSSLSVKYADTANVRKLGQ